MVGLLEKLLVSRSRDGDSNAFRLLMREYKKPLYSYLLKLSGDRITAEDLFQDTLIKVWRGMNSYNEQNKFSSWLFSIAHNVAIDSFRKKRVRKTISLAENMDSFAEVNNSPASAIEHKETKEILQSALKTLPEKQKRVFLLRQHGGLSFNEIAELTKEPLNTVLSHMHYAVKKLRIILRENNAI